MSMWYFLVYFIVIAISLYVLTGNLVKDCNEDEDFSMTYKEHRKAQDMQVMPDLGLSQDEKVDHFNRLDKSLDNLVKYTEEYINKNYKGDLLTYKLRVIGANIQDRYMTIQNAEISHKKAFLDQYLKCNGTFAVPSFNIEAMLFRNAGKKKIFIHLHYDCDVDGVEGISEISPPTTEITSKRFVDDPMGCSYRRLFECGRKVYINYDCD